MLAPVISVPVARRRIVMLRGILTLRIMPTSFVAGLLVYTC
jgi:hypothetical protein